MFTPQQIEQISFGRATFGGYDMQAVDEFLEPLTEDYLTLYKENALLKSKMRVLVGKLEEYRANEASMKEAIVNSQKTCDMMVKETEAKCTQMLDDANSAAAEAAKGSDAMIAAENARVEEARRIASEQIQVMEAQVKACLETLTKLREAECFAAATAAAEDAPKAGEDDGLADEISLNLESLVGYAETPTPKVEPKHPVSDTTTKFANLQFGRNYDPLGK